VVQFAVAGLLLCILTACSPEATRERDGGAGADIGNKEVARAETPDARAADTTLWPGRNPAPTDRLAAGTMHPPITGAPAGQATPRSDRRSFDKGTGADPRRPTSGGVRP
jgi:hypothetical protein